MRILIADDDNTSRSILAGVLTKIGHEIIAVRDGKQAFEELQKPTAPFLAILDWIMPAMDGIEVIQAVRAIPTDKPPYLIMLTSKNDKSDIIEGLQAGADDYLAKPFDVGELQARVEVGKRMIDMRVIVADKILMLNRAMEQINTLQGILPICAFCKKIRNDQGYWDQVEAYVARHSEAEFSHSICPSCLKTHYPEYQFDR
jgi:DNA-binding response OmpR family regulator